MPESFTLDALGITVVDRVLAQIEQFFTDFTLRDEYSVFSHETCGVNAVISRLECPAHNGVVRQCMIRLIVIAEKIIFAHIIQPILSMPTHFYAHL